MFLTDMSNFYKQYKSIQPWLKRKDTKTDVNREHLQSPEDRKQLDGMYEVRQAWHVLGLSCQALLCFAVNIFIKL